VWVRALTLLFASGALLAQDADEAALQLADKTKTEAVRASNWRMLMEGALTGSEMRASGSEQHSKRLSFDARYDGSVAQDWRVIFADRLDIAWHGSLSYDDFVNTLKEAYLSWQPRTDRIADLGRINQRSGVATGYNPTDYFRAGAVRSIVSIDPASLRENRLGTVMARGQKLWSTGSLSALYAPKLADHPNDSPFSPDFGATNAKNRWLIALTQKITDSVSPQWLLYDEAGASPQLGLNLAVLLNSSTVGFLEWSGGRSRSLLSQALALPDDSAFRSRLAAGVTYTVPVKLKLSLTLEYEYNGAGLDKSGWNALRRGPPDAYAQYRSFAQTQQDLPTKRNLFLFARWQDAVIAKLDLSAMLRYDAIDHSRLAWLEARYHWNRVDLAVQWQRNSGDPGTQFGALPEQRVWQAIVTYFF
jgi:hypothetical protein